MNDQHGWGIIYGRVLVHMVIVNKYTEAPRSTSALTYEFSESQAVAQSIFFFALGCKPKSKLQVSFIYAATSLHNEHTHLTRSLT